MLVHLRRRSPGRARWPGRSRSRPPLDACGTRIRPRPWPCRAGRGGSAAPPRGAGSWALRRRPSRSRWSGRAGRGSPSISLRSAWSRDPRPSWRPSRSRLGELASERLGARGDGVPGRDAVAEPADLEFERLDLIQRPGLLLGRVPACEQPGVETSAAGPPGTAGGGAFVIDRDGPEDVRTMLAAHTPVEQFSPGAAVIMAVRAAYLHSGAAHELGPPRRDLGFDPTGGPIGSWTHRRGSIALFHRNDNTSSVPGCKDPEITKFLVGP